MADYLVNQAMMYLNPGPMLQEAQELARHYLALRPEAKARWLAERVRETMMGPTGTRT